MLEFSKDQTKTINEINSEIFNLISPIPGANAAMVAALQLTRSAMGCEENDGAHIIICKWFLCGACAARDEDNEEAIEEMEIHEALAYLVGYRAFKFNGIQGDFAQMLGSLTLIHADAKAVLMARINACTM